MRGRSFQLMMWAVVVLLAAAHFCAASDRAPVRIVTVDLGSGVFEDWLPFDEPFVIKGPLPEKADYVCVEYAKAAQGDSESRESRAELNGKKSEWRRIAGLPNDSFAVRVDALEHSTVYDFNFTFSHRLSSEELRALRVRAVGAMDTLYREFDGDGLSVDELDELVERLRAEVTPPGYHLEDRGYLSGSKLKKAFEQTPIFSAQFERDVTLDDIERDSEELKALLDQAEAAGVGPSVLVPFRKAEQRADSLADVWGAAEVRDGTLRQARAAVEDLRVRGELAESLAAPIDTVLMVLSDGYNQLERALTNRNEAIVDAAERLELLAGLGENKITISGSTSGSFKTRALWHVSQDLGLAWFPSLEEVAPFFGLNIYLRPINRDVPARGFSRRFAVTVGVTLQSIKKEGERDDILSGVTPIVGAGVRLSEFSRISAGILIFKKNDPNPLVTDWDPALEGYLALGLDIEFKDLIKRFGSVFD